MESVIVFIIKTRKAGSFILEAKDMEEALKLAKNYVDQLIAQNEFKKVGDFYIVSVEATELILI